MKIIMAVMLLSILPVAAGISDNVSTDNSYCKIGIDTGNAIIFVTAHLNPATGLWEVWLGSQNYMGSTWLPKVFNGDRDGVVAITMPP